MDRRVCKCGDVHNFPPSMCTTTPTMDNAEDPFMRRGFSPEDISVLVRLASYVQHWAVLVGSNWILTLVLCLTERVWWTLAYYATWDSKLQTLWLQSCKYVVQAHSWPQFDKASWVWSSKGMRNLTFCAMFFLVFDMPLCCLLEIMYKHS